MFFRRKTINNKSLDKRDSVTKLPLEYSVGRATNSDWEKNRLQIKQFYSVSSLKKNSKELSFSVFKFKKSLFFLNYIRNRRILRIAGHYCIV